MPVNMIDAVPRTAAALLLAMAGLACAAPAAAADPATPPTDPTKTVEPGRRTTLPAIAPTLVFTVDVRWMGSSPYRVEHEITSRVEQALRTLPGVREIHSTVLSGRAQTLVTFDAKEDASSLASAIRARLDQIRTRLPHDASKPLIGWRREPAA